MTTPGGHFQSGGADASPVPTPSAAPLQGPALLDDLRRGSVALPNKTLLALALGGLRVRMMRSVVTMGSIVLAIAFLAYTGLTSQLTRSLGQKVQSLESYQPQPPGLVARAAAGLDAPRLIAALAPDDQRRLGVALGLDQVSQAESDLAGATQESRALDDAASKAAAQATQANADPDASAYSRQHAAMLLQQAQARADKARADRDALAQKVALGQWLRDPRAATSSAEKNQPALLTARLQRLASADLDDLASPVRLADSDLSDLAGVLTSIAPGAAPDDLAALRLAMDHEHRKRDAARLRGLLQSAGVSLAAAQHGDPIDTWLIVMAMLTCAVGIANAMLMSVTERFREIGTMKCLGAQDNLVVKLFLLESSFLGVFGAALGIVVGLGVALLGALLQFQTFGWTQFPVLAGLPVIFLSVLGGVALSVVGAVYPAFAASRMRPVDALRVDE